MLLFLRGPACITCVFVCVVIPAVTCVVCSFVLPSHLLLEAISFLKHTLLAILAMLPTRLPRFIGHEYRVSSASLSVSLGPPSLPPPPPPPPCRSSFYFSVRCSRWRNRRMTLSRRSGHPSTSTPPFFWQISPSRPTE